MGEASKIWVITIFQHGFLPVSYSYIKNIFFYYLLWEIIYLAFLTSTCSGPWIKLLSGLPWIASKPSRKYVFCLIPIPILKARKPTDQTHQCFCDSFPTSAFQKLKCLKCLFETIMNAWEMPVRANVKISSGPLFYFDSFLSQTKKKYVYIYINKCSSNAGKHRILVKLSKLKW